MDDKPQAANPLTTPQAWLCRIADAIPGILWSTDCDLRFTSVWGAGLADLNLQPHELVGKTLYEYLGSEDREPPMIALHRRALGGETASHEHDWEGTTYQIRVAPLTDDAGQIVGCTGIAQDVADRIRRDDVERVRASSRDTTEQERAREALRGSEELLTSVVESISDGLVVFDNELHVTYFNHAMEALSGTPREEVVDSGKLPWEIFPHLAEQGVDEMMERAREGDTARRDAIPFSLPGGQTGYTTETYFPLRGGSGEIQGVVGIIRDITEWRRAEEHLRQAYDELEERVRDRTAELEAINEQLRAEVAERRQAELALRESEQRYRLLFDLAPVGIGVADLEGNVLDCNRCQQEITGYRLEELVVVGVEATYEDPEDRRALLEVLQRSGRIRDWEVRLKRKDGTVYDALLNVDLLELGGQKRLFTIIRDVTRMKETEEALRRAERLASVGTLAAGIAHEINNPLGAIALSAETALASKGQPDSEEVLDRSLANIHASAERCGRIVKSILRFARARTSEKSRGGLGEVIHRALDLTRKLAADAKVTVHVELGAGRAEMFMNPTEMEQVFVNLISNAVQASEPGGSVIIRVEPAADGVDVLVEDHGCGMTEEQARRIFDPFYTTRHREGGTGLGLSITYGIVQDHAGTIRATTAPGKGTTMRVTLPLDPVREQGTNTPDSAGR